MGLYIGLAFMLCVPPAYAQSRVGQGMRMSPLEAYLRPFPLKEPDVIVTHHPAQAAGKGFNFVSPTSLGFIKRLAQRHY